jgi:hypothetical protein
VATRDEIADFLEDANIGEVGVDLFKGQFPPDTPNECGAVMDLPGLKPDYVMGTGGVPSHEKPKLDIRFRGEPNDYATPRALAGLAWVALSGVAKQTLGSTRYVSITPIQTPFEKERDKKGRPEVGFTIEVEKAL